jgi:hypothetical protein
LSIGHWKTQFTGFGGELGVAVFLNPKVSFDVQAAFRQINATPKNEDDEKVTETSIGLKIGFGIFL